MDLGAAGLPAEVGGDDPHLDGAAGGQLVAQPVQDIGPTSDEDQVHAGGSQAGGDLAADAAGCAGDDGPGAVAVPEPARPADPGDRRHDHAPDRGGSGTGLEPVRTASVGP
jgi:hypothetical protein